MSVSVRLFCAWVIVIWLQSRVSSKRIIVYKHEQLKMYGSIISRKVGVLGQVCKKLTTGLFRQPTRICQITQQSELKTTGKIFMFHYAAVCIVTRRGKRCATLYCFYNFIRTSKSWPNLFVPNFRWNFEPILFLFCSSRLTSIIWKKEIM